MAESRIKIQLKILHQNLGAEHWEDYKKINQNFRKEIGAASADYKLARDYIDRGLQVIILAFCGTEPAGFIRLDLRSQPPVIGDVYVEPKFRGEMAVENAPWLKNEESYKVWQHLDKAAHVIGKRLAHTDPESYVHTEVGQRIRDWRMSEKNKWESEVNVREPKELFDLLEKNKRPSKVSRI